MSEYLVVIEHEGESWGAYCPDLPGLGVLGDTRKRSNSSSARPSPSTSTAYAKLTTRSPPPPPWRPPWSTFPPRSDTCDR